MTEGAEFKKELLLFAEDVNNAAKRTLGTRKIGKNKSYGQASGKLRKSLKFKLVMKGKSMRVEFGSPLKYATFLHFGVNGTNKNRNSPYSYRSKQPPVSAVLKWMKVKPVRLRDKNGRFISQQPRAITRGKNKGKMVNPIKSAAFLIARSIKRNGIAGLRYYEKAYTAVYPKYKKRLGKAYADDLAKKLTALVGTTTIKS